MSQQYPALTSSSQLLAGTAMLALLGCTTDVGADVTPLETNENQLVEQAVVGYVAPPFQGDPPLRVNPEGEVTSAPGTGSITYNYRTGDSAVDMAGDHVEPAVSIHNLGRDGSAGSPENRALNVLSQVGNEARIVNAQLGDDIVGATGRVIGKHGGIEHVMVEFPDEVYEDLVIGDRMQIRAVGHGLEATNVDDIYLRNVSPDLIEALTERGMGVTDEGALRIPVARTIPAKIMGSGLGRNHVFTGDYDIQMFDKDVNERYGLDELRFGDLVAISDADNKFGRIYRGGAITVGVVVHGNSNVAGHGPGVTALFTSPGGNIEIHEDDGANLDELFDLR